jgi:hypothetical protein
MPIPDGKMRFPPNLENLSSFCGKVQSNDHSLRTTYTPNQAKIFGMFYIST